MTGVCLYGWRLNLGYRIIEFRIENKSMLIQMLRKKKLECCEVKNFHESLNFLIADGTNKELPTRCPVWICGIKFKNVQF